MNRNSTMNLGIARQKSDLLLVGTLFLLEFSFVVIAIALYMKGERPLPAFLFAKPGVALLCAIASFVIGCAFIVRQYLVSKRSSLHHFSLIVTMNVLTVVLILVTGEIATRVLSQCHGL